MTDEELRKHFEITRQHFDVVAEGLRNDNEELKSLFETTEANMRRHFDVVAEGLTKNVQLIAERVDHLDEKFTREFVSVREEMKEGFAETRALIDSSYGHLDRRVSALERHKR